MSQFNDRNNRLGQAPAARFASADRREQMPLAEL